MIENPSNLTDQILNLCERVATELKAIYNKLKTATYSVNNIKPTSDGNITIGDATTSASGLMSKDDKTKLGNLAKVATSGSYNDLSNKPTIPAAYTLPNATDKVLGGVKVGTNISVSSGTISVANASTSAKGVVQLSSAVNSTSTSLAATASAVKSAYDLAKGKQSPATSLSGYGITDAYTKTQVDAKIPTSLPANGGNAATVGGFTVGVSVPANAKFTDTTYSSMTAATSSAAGKSGLVPAPAAGKQASFLRGDGTWVVPTDTKYTHPTHTAKSNGFYKVTVDSLGHVTGTNAVTKADITALGIPSQDTTYTLSSFGITATAAELNYCDGVTSNIQTQLNAKASSTCATSSRNIIFAGTAWGEGAAIYLHGKDYSTNGKNGVFEIVAATTSNNAKTLTGKPDGTLSWSGSISATSFTATSDRKLKSDLMPITGAYNKLDKLHGYTYNLKNVDGRLAGLIAQDVKEVLPEAVKETDGHLTLDYNAVIALLVEAVKELKVELRELKYGK